MATWDQNTILLAASQVFEGDPATKTVLMEQWLYKFGEGWTSLGPIGNSDFLFKISPLHTVMYSNILLEHY